MIPSAVSDVNQVDPLIAHQNLESDFAKAHQAQLAWSQRKSRERTAILSNLRSLLVESRRELADAIESYCRQDFRETITSEIMPLADTAQWLHKSAKRVLSARKLSRLGSPLWLGPLRSEVHRVPYGLVLIIGTWNYPLFLPGVQILHALAAGNAVALKPAPGCDRVSHLLLSLLERAGVPKELIVLLDSSVETAQKAIKMGVDKVVMTGSSHSGRKVLHALADKLTPTTMELSGCDAMFVLPGADLHRVCDLIIFSLRLNGGATCMAPRRVFITKQSGEVFHRLLKQKLDDSRQQSWSTKVSKQTYDRLWVGIREAIDEGARVFSGPTSQNTSVSMVSSSIAPGDSLMDCGHVVLTNVNADMALCSADIFAPLAMIIPVENWSEALRTDARCPYALTASIFGPPDEARRVANFVSAGFVSINDVIVPTADPRLPFGGRGESGFGVTRGDEGLLEMTIPKVVSTRLGSWLPHAKLPELADEQLLDGLLQFNHHHDLRARLSGLIQTVRAAMSRPKTDK